MSLVTDIAPTTETTQATRLPGPAAHTLAEIPEYDLALLVDGFARYGDLYQLPPAKSSGRDSNIVVVSDPIWAKHVLSANHINYTKGIGIERVRILLGNGIMVSEGSFWRKQRKLLQPSFHPQVLQGFSDQLQACNRALLTKWQAAVAKQHPINITADLSHVTLQFILKAILSDDLEHITQSQGSNPFDIVTEESARDLQFARKFRELTRLVRDIIAQRRDTGDRPFDFLSLMMEVRDRKTGKGMSEKELVDETMTLIIAGHETTASALNWTWYLLSQHPDIEAKLHHEVDTVLAARLPSLDDLPALPYTKQVLQEALRLYPPGWLLTRRAIGEDTIAGYSIAPDTDIFISPYIMHRHPEYWPDPERFDPERFTEENAAGRHRFAYIPFAAGARNCIGDHLAMCEMQLHLATMAQHFRVTYHGTSPVGLSDLEAQVNLRAKAPLPLTLVAR